MDGSPSPGATPLDPDEAEGLIPAHVTTRGELDELEEANIQEGLRWAYRRVLGRTTPVDVLTESFVYELHRQMFGAVWEWAGTVDKFQVPTELRKLIDDARYWRENGVYPDAELAVRFHHRLVWIHPFPNGNGRLARLVADLIIQQTGAPPFSWGGASLEKTSDLRAAYIDALRKADQGDLDPLISFAHS